jgi:hypothetical protein
MEDNNKQYTNKLTELDNQFALYETIFKDIRDYILPRRGMFLEDGSPDQQDPKARQSLILDGTGGRSNRIGGAGMQGGLASPSRPWFRNGLFDSDLENFAPVKNWLAEVDKRMYRVFAKSNFYNVSHSCFEEQMGFGTGPILQLEDPETVMNFRLSTAGRYRIANGPNDRVDTLYRNLWMTARNMVAMFGIDKVSSQVKAAVETSNTFKYFRVVHVIEPRTDRNPNMIDNLNMPFKSVWFEYSETDQVLREGGFEEFPGAVPRWSTVDDQPYGFAPGHDALADVKMLQELQKTGLKGLHKLVDPPMRTPAKYKGILDLRPGATNPVDSADRDAVGELYKINLPLDALENKITRTQEAIEKSYYTDLFLMLSQATGRSDMTATEVIERHEEKLLMLGPTIERQLNEFLAPVLSRAFDIMDRAGLIPTPPDEVQGKEMKTEFISLLAQAQKLVTSKSIHAYLGMAERVAALDEASLAKTDFDQLLDEFGDVVGVPPSIIRSDENVEKRRAAEAEAAANAQQTEQAALAAKTAKDLGGASTATGTALGDLKEAMQ